MIEMINSSRRAKNPIVSSTDDTDQTKTKTFLLISSDFICVICAICEIRG